MSVKDVVFQEKMERMFQKQTLPSMLLLKELVLKLHEEALSTVVAKEILD